MTVPEDPRSADSWLVVATSAELPPGQIAQSFLQGQELALWRDSHGAAHVWENRCPHRGTRFTMGRIVEDQLSCAYHGWRFAAGGHCTYIPAHPGLTPPKAVCAKTYAAKERYGMVWASLGSPTGDVPALARLEDGGTRRIFCRSFVTHCEADDAAQQLVASPDAGFERVGPLTLMGMAAAGATPIVFVQPMGSHRSIWHLWLAVCAGAGNEHALRDQHVAALKKVRARVEAEVAAPMG